MCEGWWGMIGLGLIWHVNLLLPVVEATTQLKVHKEMFGVGKRPIMQS